jgi:hypothetical protein
MFFSIKDSYLMNRIIKCVKDAKRRTTMGNERIDNHNAASMNYPLRANNKPSEQPTIGLSAWGIEESKMPLVLNDDLIFGAKSSEPIEIDFETGFTKNPELPSEEAPQTALTESKAKEMIATCDFETHPDSCDVEVPKVETSVYCEFDTHPESCEQEPVQAQNLYTPIKKGDNLGKYAKALYGSSSDPEVLKAIAEANPESVKTVKTTDGKNEYRLHFDSRKETELVLPYVITKKDGTTISTNEGFLPKT